MKTLINKFNPAIRITSPEIEEYEHFYSIPNWYGYNKSDWTLVEEDPKKLHIDKPRGYKLVSEDATANGFNQPTKPVDLEKEIDKTVSECTNGYNFDWDRFARHFYELGLNARKK